MKPFLLIIILFLSVSCANTADTVSIDTLDGEYALTGIRGSNFAAEDIKFKFNPVGNTVSGDTGCNRFSANFHQDGKDVVFTTPISTRKFCEGKMRTEQRILSSFEEASKFNRTGNEFAFLSEGNKLLFTLTKTN